MDSVMQIAPARSFRLTSQLLEPRAFVTPHCRVRRRAARSAANRRDFGENHVWTLGGRLKGRARLNRL